ncbi:MAG TPA: DUF6644 family protein [Bryobacteraceae bacterium]|nr:DUF6644 family protein [Bryobacteraceae bacterium]
MLLSFAQWVQATAFFTALRGSSYVYPIILSLHMAGVAFFGGMVLLTDMRLLGLAMRKHSLADVVGNFRVPKRAGLLIVATCGILLACSKAEEYYYNAFFRTKLILLTLACIHALVFRSSVYAKAADLDRAPKIPGNAKLAGALSLLIWASIACMGRGIGYIEPPLNKIHAQMHVIQEAALAAFRAPAEFIERGH